MDIVAVEKDFYEMGDKLDLHVDVRHAAASSLHDASLSALTHSDSYLVCLPWRASLSLSLKVQGFDVIARVVHRPSTPWIFSVTRWLLMPSYHYQRHMGPFRCTTRMAPMNG